jgi:ParB-like chromosome segregation protein Spo0J
LSGDGQHVLFGDLVPPLAESDFERLKADIKANGVRHPIEVDEDGNILDGHHRYRIDPKAPRIVVKLTDDLEKRAYVHRAAADHRNMSSEQQAEQRARMKKLAAEMKAAGWIQQRIGEALWVDQSQVSRWLSGSNMQSHNHFPKSYPRKVQPSERPTILAEIEAGKRAAQVAANYGVTEPSVRTY